MIVLSKFRTADVCDAAKDVILSRLHARPSSLIHPLAQAALEGGDDSLGLAATCAELGRRIAGPSAGTCGHYSLVKAGFSTSDFQDLLGDLVRTLVTKGATETLQHRAACQVVPAPDFRPFAIGTADASGDFSALTQGQEAPAVSVSGLGGETLVLQRYSKILDVQLELIVDDAVGLLDSLARQVGQAALRTEQRKVIEVLTADANMSDGGALFGASNAMAATDPVSLAGLGSGFNLMRQQSGAAGDQPLNLEPRFAVVAPENEVAFRALLWQAQLQLDVIVHTAVAQDSYYLLAGPAQHGSIGLSFVGPGTTGAMPRTYQTRSFRSGGISYLIDHDSRSFRSGGISYRIDHDFGVAAVSRLGVVKVSKA